MARKLIPTLLCDFYKIGHREQYPEGTEVVYSTWTPRSGKYMPGADGAVCAGLQAFIKEYVIDFFDENFFSRSKEGVVAEYSRYLKYTLLIAEPHTKHIEDLHDLGYMPFEIRALKEGTLVPFRVPMMTIHNTDPRFFWLTNYIETLASAELWKVSTTATSALGYRRILDEFALETNGSIAGVEFQGHDFSMRGMSGVYDAATSGMGHLLSFVGTDTIPAIMGLEQYYNANIETELVGTSVNATEHSVMCAGGKEDEFETYRRLIEDIYPTGIVSIVSDTWDLWHVVDVILPKLKDKIMARDGGAESLDKVVIRPDSGIPANIICGDPNAPVGSSQYKGLVERLYEIFGGTVNKQGYKLLDSHIGSIYGEAITKAACREICERLKAKGFASVNQIYGIGSFTYQYNTRDTLGFALKSTLTIVNGKEVHIFKDPKTDDGTKKSAKGRVAVYEMDGKMDFVDELSLNENVQDLMDVVFKDGVLLRNESLAEIRARLANN